MKKVRVGIIGAGRIGKIHAENLLTMLQVDVVAICDLYAEEELFQWAAERGIRMVTKDASVIFQNPDIDAVLICSSTDSHISFIEQAAAAGKSIFCEKPISMDVSQTKHILETVRAAGVQLQIGFNRRFDHNFKRVREVVQEGRIGTPQMIKITSRDPNPPHEDYIKVSGGIFQDMMIHDFDMARYVAGSDIEEVNALGGVLIDPVFAEHGDLDTAIATLRFVNGAIGVIDCSRQAVYGYDQRVEVFGSKGCVAVANDHPNTAEISTSDGIFRDNPLHFFLERYSTSYFDEVNQFIACIQQERPVPVSGYDGFQAELTALACKYSIKLGRPVKLSEVIAWLEQENGQRKSDNK